MLSESAVKKLAPRASPYRVFDTCGIAGFGVQVTPAGNRGYFLRYADSGKSRYLALGHHPHTPLAAAREKARAARARLDQGLPIVAPEPTGATLNALVIAWLEHQRSNERRRLDDVERMIRGNVPAELLAKPARLVVAEDIRALLAVIHQRGARVYANRLRAHLHAVFQYGLKADHDPRRLADPVLFGITSNPVAAIPRDAGAEQARERVLSWSEINAVWWGEELPWAARHAVRLLLLTGQRVNEVCRASWAEIDFEAAVWTLPAVRSKNHRTHLIPLSPVAIDLLRELWNVFPGDWLFPARNVAGAAAPWGDTALSHAVMRWQKAHSAADAWRPQDVRRTMKTRAVEVGIGRDILDKIQNHAQSDVASRHYDRHDYLPEKRAALEQWARELLARLAGDNVRALPLKRRA